jgi:hypothetical protein
VKASAGGYPLRQGADPEPNKGKRVRFSFNWSINMAIEIATDKFQSIENIAGLVVYWKKDMPCNLDCLSRLMLFI